MQSANSARCLSQSARSATVPALSLLTWTTSDHERVNNAWRVDIPQPLARAMLTRTAWAMAMLIIGVFQLAIFFGYSGRLEMERVPLLILAAVMTVTYIDACRWFGLGFASITLTLAYLPAFSACVYAPVQEVQESLDPHSRLIRTHGLTVAAGCVWFFCAWYAMMVLTDMRAERFDARYFVRIIANHGRRRSLTMLIFSLLAIASVLIFRPFLPGGKYDLSRPPLLPGNAWQYVALISYLFIVCSRVAWSSLVALIGVPIWLLVHYARADVIAGLVISYQVYALKRLRPQWAWRPGARMVILGLVLVSFMAYIGVVRNEGWSFSFGTVGRSVASLLNYGTVQDVVYSSAAAVEVEATNGPAPTLWWVIESLPPSFLTGRGAAREPSIYVAEHIHTNQGILIAFEFYLNFNILGVIICPFALYGLHRTCIAVAELFDGDWCDGILGPVTYLVCVLTAPRTFWYGTTYLMKEMFVLLPALFVLYVVMSRLEVHLRGRVR